MSAAKRSRKYKIAVYMILTLLAIVLAILGFWKFEAEQPVLTLLLNMSTELAGAALIFLIVEWFFGLGESSDTDERLSLADAQIRALLAEQEKGRNPFLAGDVARRQFDFRNLLKTADSVDIAGYSCANFLAHFRIDIAGEIRRGLTFRLMMVDPGNSAGALMQANIADPNGTQEPHERSMRYLREIAEILDKGEQPKGSFTVKLLNCIPSCFVNLVNSGRPDGRASVGINSFVLETGVPRRLDILLSKAVHPREFQYFVDQYERLWESERNTLVDP